VIALHLTPVCGWTESNRIKGVQGELFCRAVKTNNPDPFNYDKKEMKALIQQLLNEHQCKG